MLPIVSNTFKLQVEIFSSEMKDHIHQVIFSKLNIKAISPFNLKMYILHKCTTFLFQYAHFNHPIQVIL